MRKIAIALFFFLVFLGQAKASYVNVYFAQAAVGAANGADCADALGINSFDSPAIWGSGANQIGIGTIVHLCGTITRAGGVSGLLPQAGGSVSSPLVIFFEPNAILQAPFFGSVCQFSWGGDGTDINGGCFSGGVCSVNCNAGIELEHNYIIVDGGVNGIVQSTHNGTNFTPVAVPGSGPTAGGSQQPNTGVYIGPVTGAKVRNLTIQHIYDNGGAGSTGDCGGTTGIGADNHVGPPCDTGGNASRDLSIAKTSVAVSVCNTALLDARVGIDLNAMAVAHNQVDLNCQSNTFVDGLNIFNNFTDKHAWQMSVSNNGDPSDETINIYTNKFGETTNWVGPMSAYHMDGIILQPYGGTGNIYAYIFNNWFSGDNSGSNSTGDLFLSALGTGSDDLATVFNNLFSTTNPNPGGQAVVIGNGNLSTTHTIGFYQNTYMVWPSEMLVYGAPNFPFQFKNEVRQLGNFGGTVGTNTWYWQPDGPANFPQLAGTDYNAYWLTPPTGCSGFAISNCWPGEWAWTGVQYSTPNIAAWRTASGVDAHSVFADPLLDSTGHITSASSSAVGRGQNLTASCSGAGVAPAMAYLCFDKPATVGVGGTSIFGNPRPSNLATNWDAGVYNFGTVFAPQVNLSPGSINFGNQTIGTSSASQTVTLSNTGNATLNISSILTTGNFSGSTNCASTLAAGSSCQIFVTFSPASLGPLFGNVSITDDAAGSPQAVSLSGTGTPAVISAPAAGAVIQGEVSTGMIQQ